MGVFRVKFGSTVHSVRKYLQTFFENRLVSEPKESADYIVAHVLGSETIFNLRANQRISQWQRLRMMQLTRKRCRNMPIQYVLGEWNFHGHSFLMRQPVFIPRPETEELVQLVQEHCVYHKCEKLLEIGCGSGAICVTLLSSISKLQALAIDANSEACQLTTDNARRLNVDSRLTVLHCTLNGKLENSKELQFLHHAGFDCVVSNPPYVPRDDIADFHPELRYESYQAFDGGADGLDVVRDMLHIVPSLLRSGGSLWLEVDTRHPPVIESLVKQQYASIWQYVTTQCDFTNRPRFCHLRLLESSVQHRPS